MRTYTDAELQDETIWAEACVAVEALLAALRARWLGPDDAEGAA